MREKKKNVYFLMICLFFNKDIFEINDVNWKVRVKMSFFFKKKIEKNWVMIFFSLLFIKNKIIIIFFTVSPVSHRSTFYEPKLRVSDFPLPPAFNSNAISTVDSAAIHPTALIIFAARWETLLQNPLSLILWTSHRHCRHRRRGEI